MQTPIPLPKFEDLIDRLDRGPVPLNEVGPYLAELPGKILEGHPGADSDATGVLIFFDTGSFMRIDGSISPSATKALIIRLMASLIPEFSTSDSMRALAAQLADAAISFNEKRAAPQPNENQP